MLFKKKKQKQTHNPKGRKKKSLGSIWLSLSRANALLPSCRGWEVFFRAPDTPGWDGFWEHRSPPSLCFLSPHPVYGSGFGSLKPFRWHRGKNPHLRWHHHRPKGRGHPWPPPELGWDHPWPAPGPALAASRRAGHRRWPWWPAPRQAGLRPSYCFPFLLVFPDNPPLIK